MLDPEDIPSGYWPALLTHLIGFMWQWKVFSVVVVCFRAKSVPKFIGFLWFGWGKSSILRPCLPYWLWRTAATYHHHFTDIRVRKMETFAGFLQVLVIRWLLDLSWGSPYKFVGCWLKILIPTQDRKDSQLLHQKRMKSCICWYIWAMDLLVSWCWQMKKTLMRKFGSKFLSRQGPRPPRKTDEHQEWTTTTQEGHPLTALSIPEYWLYSWKVLCTGLGSYRGETM